MEEANRKEKKSEKRSGKLIVTHGVCEFSKFVLDSGALSGGRFGGDLLGSPAAAAGWWRSLSVLKIVRNVVSC